MKIKILKRSLVGEIKTAFSVKFPFLKLEFLTSQRLSSGGQHVIIAPDNARLYNIQPAVNEGGMVVSELTEVGDLECFFRNHFLDVQVFRRSANLWLETTMTDAWTLEKQNNHGKEISEFNVSRQKRNYENDLANGAV